MHAAEKINVSPSSVETIAQHLANTASPQQLLNALIGFEALLDTKHEILKSSSARIYEELLRMLESGASKPFFHLLNQYGMLEPLLPELAHYLEIQPETTIFSLLEEIDAEVKNRTAPKLDRSLLIAALLFPLFEKYLQTLQKQHRKKLHLGLITESAHYVIDCIFTPFFNIPRRTRSIVAFLMSSQYRFIPIDGRKLQRIKPFSDPFFPVALYLLKLRSSVHSELLPHYTQWTEASFNVQVLPYAPDEIRERRPRRRRRRPNG